MGIGVTPLPNAPVRLYTGNTLTFFGSATTSGTGAFSFSSLPAGQFSVYAFDQSPNPTKFAYATGTATAGSSVTQNLTLSGTSQVTVRVFTLLGAQAPNAVVGLTPNAVPVPADLSSTIRAQQTAGANGQTVFTNAFACNFIADAADSNGQFSSIVFGTVASGGSVTVDITLNAPEAVSQVVAILNGPPYGNTLPAGQNEDVSAIVSLLNGLPAGNTLPAGQNEGVSAIVSLFNGIPGGNTLPAGQNEGVSAIVSLFNGIAPGNTLPSGFNEAVSSIVLAQVTNSGGAFRILNPALVSSKEADSSSPVTGASNRLVAGETVTV